MMINTEEDIKSSSILYWNVYCTKLNKCFESNYVRCVRKFTIWLKEEKMPGHQKIKLLSGIKAGKLLRKTAKELD